MNNITLNVLLDYFRLVSYGVVILSSLKGIVRRRFTSLLFVGDVIMATFTVSTLICFRIIGDMNSIGDEILLTVGASAWATIHFITMLKNGRKENRASKL